jgi:hypothetical protein
MSFGVFCLFLCSRVRGGCGCRILRDNLGVECGCMYVGFVVMLCIVVVMLVVVML